LFIPKANQNTNKKRLYRPSLLLMNTVFDI
jgi:hypothetical protein